MTAIVPGHRLDRFALSAALLLFAGLALFGARYHWVEEAGSAERDGYVDQARLILSGSLPRDPFRPLLYPLLTAGIARAGSLGGIEPFTAARLVSNAAAAALAWLAFAFGRRLAGPRAGFWAMALLAVNPNLWILGQHVSTDMLFAALAAAALLAAFRYLEEPGTGTAVAAGLLLGLAGFTRSNAPFLLPALAAAWWLAPGPRKERLAHLAAAGLAFGLVLVPHWALRAAVFGDPFYDENWKNVAWKLHGYPDWSYLDRVPYTGLLQLVREDPLAIVKAGFVELYRFAASGAAQLLGTWAHVLLFVAGSVYALFTRRRAAGWLLFACAVFLTATAIAFFAWGRLLLWLLPPACALAFCFMERFGESGSGKLQKAGIAVSLALVLLLAAKTFAFRLPAFVDRHPYQEVAALKRLDASLPPGLTLAGSSPFLGRYLRHHYVDLPDAFGPERTDPRLYFEKLERLLVRFRVAYLVIGEVDLRDRPASLLGPCAPVPWLSPIARQTRLNVWRVDPALAERPPQRTAPGAPPGC